MSKITHASYTHALGPYRVEEERSVYVNKKAAKINPVLVGFTKKKQRETKYGSDVNVIIYYIRTTKD